MPILEGLDGVQKMSKSLGNAIGIKEPPQEMYGKLMSISDALMWRYYELLTDVTSDQIAAMQQDVAGGVRHPMQVKHELARRIVADFHSPDEAQHAQENWIKQFSKKEVPEDVAEVEVELSQVSAGSEIRLDKLLVSAGLAATNAEAQRKIKEGAVQVNGTKVQQPKIPAGTLGEGLLKCGRQIKRVRLAESGQPAS
jgi:tyrosyl-tRNA synthetase